MKTTEINPGTPLDQVIHLLESGPPGPWPNGWTGWENVHVAHLKLLERFVQRLPDYPGGFSGRGIVSAVSAKPGWSSGKELAHGYFPGAWVLVKELRRLGCTLPITFAHLGPLEWDPQLTKLVEPFGVRVIDLREWEKTHPMRILAGWETKIAAVLAAPYEEVLFLDADNVPVRDPSFLFDEPSYRDLGSIFWPDLPPHDRPEWLPVGAWASVGLEYREEIDFESGQFIVHKRKCWQELAVTRWLNEHSDRYFDVFFGDKSTYHMGWAKLGTRYGMPRYGAGWNGGAILQFDMNGQLLFEHGAQNKPTLAGYPRPICLSHSRQCQRHLEELRSQWNGRLWESNHSTGTAAEIAAKLLGRVFLYRRIGLGERPIRFLEDNRIGRGAARCEFGWSVMEDEKGSVLAVNDVEGKLTMLLREENEGIWRGRWQEHERVEVELLPMGEG